MTLIEPPKRTSELVVSKMEQLIHDGAWPVGSRIPPEPVLVEEFGVGRNTIREAVRALEHAGMLIPRRGDGTYVRCRNAFTAAMERNIAADGKSAAELRDLLAVRRALEAEAAALAAARATTADRKRLGSRLIAAENALASGDVSGYADADIAFHSDLVQASGNPLLIELYSGVLEVMTRAHLEIVERYLSDAAATVSHRNVVEAIDDSDPGAARDAVYTYLREAEGGLDR